MPARGWVFRYHAKDALLVCGGLANVACVLGTFAFFNDMPGWLGVIMIAAGVTTPDGA